MKVLENQSSETEALQWLRNYYDFRGMKLDPVSYLAEINRWRREGQGRAAVADMTLADLKKRELDPNRQLFLHYPGCGDRACKKCKGSGYLDHESGSRGPCFKRCNKCMPPMGIYFYGMVGE
jgi:hypothetical protein